MELWSFRWLFAATPSTLSSRTIRMCEWLIVVSGKVADNVLRAFRAPVAGAHETLLSLRRQGSARNVAAVAARSNLMHGRDMVYSLSAGILLQESTPYQFVDDDRSTGEACCQRGKAERI